MNKYNLVQDPSGMPERVYALPGLQFPHKTNVTRALFEKVVREGWCDRTAFISGENKITYKQVIENTSRYAVALKQINIKVDDRVILRMHDTPEAVYALLAVQALGAIAVLTFEQFRSDDILYRVQDTEAKVAVVAEELLDEFIKVADQDSTLADVLIVDNDPTGRFRSLSELAPKPAYDIPYADTDADDLALIVYTSGTTGRPKGCAHSHRDLLAAGETFARFGIKLEPTDVIAGPPSLPFSMGLSFLVYYPFTFGSASILSPDKSVEYLTSAIEYHKVTVFFSVPTYYSRMLDYLHDNDIDITSLRMTLCGGEPLSTRIAEKWREVSGNHLLQFLGSSEMFHIFISFRYGEDTPRSDVIGRAIAGYEVVVRDPDTFEEVPTGEPGIMTVRGPTATAYWSPRDIQSKAVRNGWNVIQDTIYQDGNGFFHFVGRADDMIISGGFNIAPGDVEEVLQRHPAVKECACVPSPDDKNERSSVVKAFITLREGYTPADALTREIQDFFKQHGTPFMYPRKIEYLQMLPRGITGKILRSELKKKEYPSS